MKFQRHFLRIATLPIASILFIIGVAAYHPVCASGLQAESDAERYVLEQIQKGDRYADLDAKFPSKSFPEKMRQLRGSFIAALLVSRDVGVETHRQEIAIANAI